MNKTDSRQKKEVQALRRKPDSKIDLSDISEMDWSKGERGRFYRPIKQMVSLRIDADILAWFKSHHPKYQTAVNEALRDYIKHQ
jgi:uncharacterized protein (DUF4415 family)